MLIDRDTEPIKQIYGLAADQPQLQVDVSLCCTRQKASYKHKYILPARELTYPTFVKGNSSSKVPAGTGICSFLRRVYMYVYMAPGK